MKTRLRALTALVAFSFIAVTSVGTSSADAEPERAGELPDLRGHFAAFTRSGPDQDSIGNPDTVPGSLDITAQAGPVLIGQTNLAGHSTAGSGTLGPGESVNLQGIGADFDGPYVVEAQAHSIDTGPWDGGTRARILAGSYRVSLLSGGRQEGDLVAVHQRPVLGAPSIGGSWMGMLGEPDERLGRIEASIVQSESGALSGRLRAVLFTPEPDSLSFELTLAGQAAWDGTTSGYFLVGAGSGLLATMFVGIEDPGIKGQLRLLLTDGTAWEATLRLEPALR
ncbi:MAG: hypothetical protein GEV06_07215 [Luteitalea sp.]|nr:hypothetical protein [Luteitalea sp.]